MVSMGVLNEHDENEHDAIGLSMKRHDGMKKDTT